MTWVIIRLVPFPLPSSSYTHTHNERSKSSGLNYILCFVIIIVIIIIITITLCVSYCFWSSAAKTEKRVAFILCSLIHTHYYVYIIIILTLYILCNLRGPDIMILWSCVCMWRLWQMLKTVYYFAWNMWHYCRHRRRRFAYLLINSTTVYLLINYIWFPKRFRHPIGK